MKDLVDLDMRVIDKSSTMLPPETRHIVTQISDQRTSFGHSSDTESDKSLRIRAAIVTRITMRDADDPA